MYSGAANSAAFLQRAGSFATRGSRTGRNLLGWGEAEQMTAEQQRKALVAAKMAVAGEIVEIKKQLKNKLPYATARALQLRYDELRARATALDAQLHALAAARAPKVDDLKDCLIAVVRAGMTKPQWENIVRQARALHRTAKAGAGQAE